MRSPTTTTLAAILAITVAICGVLLGFFTGAAGEGQEGSPASWKDTALVFGSWFFLGVTGLWTLLAFAIGLMITDEVGSRRAKTIASFSAMVLWSVVALSWTTMS